MPSPAPAASPAPCSVAPQPVPCGTKTADPGKQSATQQFPFPGEASEGGASLTPYAEPAKTAAQFPFPGEDGKDGVSGTPDASAGADGSSSSSSSSSGDDAAAADPDAKTTDPDAKAAGTPGAAGLTDKGSEGTPGRHLLHRVNPVGTKLQTADEREAEDLSVAKFYSETGDLQGAYLRSQDAVKTEPDDPDAHFALAGAALKLNKRDEAIAEYKACLKLDPTDKEAREARKALERLEP